MLNFLGIGAQKSGTTWISESLNKHPDISFPGGKEIHFWDHRINNGIDWYKAIFSSNTQAKQGEITPSYAFLELDKINQIYSINPEMRLIYSIRHPVDRAWSGAMMALKRSEMSVEEASDQWFLDHFNSAGSLNRGNYVACIDNWMKVFPSEQFLIINFSDIADNPKQVLEKCAQHIGVNKGFFSDINSTELEKKIYSGTPHPDRAKLHKKLEEIYRKPLEQGKKHPLLGDIFKKFTD